MNSINTRSALATAAQVLLALNESGLSFNGQRGRSNNLSVDGADSNGSLNGNTRLTLSQEAVRGNIANEAAALAWVAERRMRT